MTAKERLVVALTEVGAPVSMIEDAARGRYDDFESDSATPILDLVNDCRRFRFDVIANRALDGEFDAE